VHLVIPGVCRTCQSDAAPMSERGR
jgi:hypothetical protein